MEVGEKRERSVDEFLSTNKKSNDRDALNFWRTQRFLLVGRSASEVWRIARDARSDRGGVDFVARDPQRPPRSITVRWKRVDVAVMTRTRSLDARTMSRSNTWIPTPTRRPEAWQRRGGANSAFVVEGCISRCANRLERFIGAPMTFDSPKKHLARLVQFSSCHSRMKRQADRTFKIDFTRSLRFARRAEIYLSPSSAFIFETPYWDEVARSPSCFDALAFSLWLLPSLRASPVHPRREYLRTIILKAFLPTLISFLLPSTVYRVWFPSKPFTQLARLRLVICQVILLTLLLLLFAKYLR